MTDECEPAMPLDVSPVEQRAGRVIAQLNRQRDHGTDHHVVAAVIIPRCGAGAKLMDGATAPSTRDDLPPRSAGARRRRVIRSRDAFQQAHRDAAGDDAEALRCHGRRP
jgi:hypothetical protein